MPIQCTRDGRIAHLSLDRPPLNILDLETIAELSAQIETLKGESLHLVVLEGCGPRAFSAGVAVEDHIPEKVDQMLSSFHEAIRSLRDLSAITLAVVHGYCLGGGCELAAACDLLLTSKEATFGLPEVELGCFPPVAAALFPRRLGSSRTLELLLTGRRFDGEEAGDLGLATWVVPEAELAFRKMEILQNLGSKSAAVARWIKKAVRGAEGESFDNALKQAETLYIQELAASEDMQEGLAAFLEKRSPHWHHR